MKKLILLIVLLSLLLAGCGAKNDELLPATYDITGTSTHPHTVTLTASHFAALQADQTVTVTSSTDDGHAHEVTVQCAG